MNKEAIKRKKDLIAHELAMARDEMISAKTSAGIADQHFENALNHARDLEELMKA